MSSLRVTSLRGRTEGTAPTLPDGAIVTGVVTATSFAGNVSGTASGLTGTPNITVGFLTATGNVAIAGTLTYDDVTRIDSVGIVTAGGGLYVGRTEGTGTGIGITATDKGHIIAAGVVTATSFVGDGSSLTGINSVSLATTAYGLSSQAHTLAGGVITISDTTESTSKDTGSFIVEGGVGIEKYLNVGGGINAVGVITASSYEGRHSQVPKNAQTSAYTLVKTDAGKCVSTNSGVTVPDAVFAAGDCVTIWNDSSSAITITQGSGFQLREAGETTTGNVSLKNFGLATLWFNTGGTAVISGNLA